MVGACIIEFYVERDDRVRLSFMMPGLPPQGQNTPTPPTSRQARQTRKRGRQDDGIQRHLF